MKIIPKFEIKIVPMSNAIKEYIKHKSGKTPKETQIKCHFWQNAKNITTRDFCKNRRILTLSAFP